ncbi:MAG: Nif3-like dinuclear metal center hexameric protein [Selenomonadaceae bacterium]|nr:Nif3-like dinuclear metal center hexameric protein [Selenomonadaceae bacterium]
MLKVQSIADALNRWAPSKLAEEWDNVGLLTGDPSAGVEKILVCLDAGLGAIERAVEIGAQMIVAHHPMIFRPIKNIRLDRPLGRRLSLLLKNDIAVFAAHTNLDSALDGVNDVLASKLGLIEVKPLGEASDEPSLGRLGRLVEPMSAADFASHVKRALGADYVRLSDAGSFPIKKVGICGGAGADFIMRAKFYGADAFVTGDVKYHEAQTAIDNGIHVIDAGHFATEHPIVEVIAARLRAEFDSIEIIEFDGETDVFRIV